MRASARLEVGGVSRCTALAAALAALPVADASLAATRQFFYTGAVATSTFSPLPAGTPFAGHYLLEDATADTNPAAGIGAYATGLFHLDWGPTIGRITFDQLGSTAVSNDAAVFFGCSDLFSLTAGEGARDTPAFANATQGGAGVTFQDFSFFCVPIPDALAGDTLTGVPHVLGPPWLAADQNVFVGFSAAGGGCPPFTTSCSAVMALGTLDPAFRLDVVKTGNGDGTVVSDPFGIDCGAVCAALMGGSIKLTATPAVGSVLEGWTGCDTAVDATCTVLLTSDREVEARFRRIFIQEIPALSPAGLALLALLLSAVGWLSIRRFR